MVADLQLSRRTLLLGALVLGLALLVAARVFRSAGTATVSPPAPARAVVRPALVVVDVVGAVHRPGLYRLSQGSRIADALARAGGATRRADLALVNLAAPLADGVQIVVPARVAPATASSVAGPAADATTGPVHLNTATLEQLDALPGVGPVTAQKILDYRQKHGAFANVDELDAVPGIGPARLEQLRDLVQP